MALWSTRKVAEEMAMTEEWVRDNAADLGAIRCGRGPRAPLRFEPGSIEAYKERQRIRPLEPPPNRPRSQTAQRAASEGIELLPVPSG